LRCPQLGPYFDEKIKNAGEHITGCKYRKEEGKITIEEWLKCGACIKRTQWIAENPNISGDALLRLNYPEIYAHPNIWPKIYTDTWTLVEISSSRFLYLCTNPSALPYIEEHKDRIPDDCWPALFENPGAIDFIISQGFSGKLMVDYGARYPHFYPYYDYNYCRQILRGQIVNGHLCKCLIENVSAKKLIEENIREIVKAYKTEVDYFIVGCQHLVDLVISHIELFTSEDCLFSMNQNCTMVPYLEQTPHLIRWGVFGLIAKDMSRVEAYISTNPSELDDLLYYLNQNPAALGFLRLHPEYIKNSLQHNPNIFID